MCKNIPAGYREKTIADAADTVARAEIVPCAVGTYSSWNGNVRTPAVNTANAVDNVANAKLCAPCTGNTYAPRTGEWRSTAQQQQVPVAGCLALRMVLQLPCC